MDRLSTPTPRTDRLRGKALPPASCIPLCLSLCIGMSSPVAAQPLDLSSPESDVAEPRARRVQGRVAAGGGEPDCTAFDGWRVPDVGRSSHGLRLPRHAVEVLLESSVTVAAAKRDGAAQRSRTGSRIRGPSRRPDRADVGASLRPVGLPERVTLVEGGDSVQLALSFERGCGEPSPARLSLTGRSEDDERDLAHRFEHEEIGGTREKTTLTLSLGIATAPLLEHTRELRLRIEQAASVREVPILVDVKPTEAPDVYLLAGQSNMEGYSERGAKRAAPGEVDEPHPRIRQLNVTANSRAVFGEVANFTDEGVNVRYPLFPRAEDPLHDSRDPHIGGKSGTFVGPGLAFAKAMLPHTTRNVYLVPAAWGATGFCANRMGELAWNAEARTADGLGGSLLIERALLRLNLALRESGGILRGILWHQGGADSNDMRCAERYAENLVRMVKRLRREARPDARGEAARGDRAAIPFVAATMSRGADERGDYSLQGPPRRIVDGVHRSIAGLLPYADVVIGDDLVPPAYPCGQNACVHYGAAANREQGRRFAETIRRIAAR